MLVRPCPRSCAIIAYRLRRTCPAAYPEGMHIGRDGSGQSEGIELALKEQGLGATDIARQMNIGRSTVYVIFQDERNGTLSGS